MRYSKFSIVTLVVSSGCLAAPPLFTPLGALPGGARIASRAYATSLDGNTIAGFSAGPNGEEAFRWTSVGGMVGLGDLDGGIFSSRARAISADGNTIVGFGSSTNGSEAYIWRPSTGMVGLGDLAGSVFNSAMTAISSDGLTLTGRGSSETGVLEACRWTSTSGMVGLGYLGVLAPNLPESHGMGISADGVVIVGYSTTPRGVYEAYRWTGAGGMQPLGDAADGVFDSRAYNVSADGQVIIGRCSTAAGYEQFRWTAAAGIVPLGDLAGGIVDARARGLSGDGSIIVGKGNTGSPTTGGDEASYWSASTGLLNLRDWVISQGTTGLDGWVLEQGYDISANGRNIVGWGADPLGRIQAWRIRLDHGCDPEITMQPAAITHACRGGIVTMSVQATGGTTRSYQWRRGGVNLSNGGNISGATTQSIVINPVTSTSEGTYSVLISNSCGSVLSNAAIFAVCIADFNCDGVVDFFDYLDFVDAFSSNAPIADFNSDGVLDFFDYLDFVDAFSQSAC